MRDKTLVKAYRDRTYVSTAMVRHGGTTVAFAMDDRRRIYYSVLDMEQAQDALGSLDAAYWNAEPGLLPFPSEIVDPYTDDPVVFALPTVKQGGTAEIRPEELFGAELDPFLSTTARLTAAAPIQVVSDGRFILVFRQSTTATDPDAVFRLTGAALSGDAARTDYAKPDGAKVPAADASLLCDRFVLVGSALKRVVEVRYQRSRSKYAPTAEGTDTLGTRDMDGKLFYEPTTKVSFVPRVTDGGFAVLLLPTEVDSVSRWQLFVNNAAEKRVESFNCEQGTDGLFDITGTQLYTSPDPRFRKSVLEREPGTDQNTKLPLVPVPPTSDRAGTALRFVSTTNGGAELGLAAMPTPSGGCTFEAWVKPTAPRSTIMATMDETRPEGFHLGVDDQYRPVAGRGDDGWRVTGTVPLTPGTYAHVALVVDGLTATLFVDGVEAGHTTVTAAPVPASAELLFTRRHGANMVDAMSGDLDEVRIWNRARTAADLADRGRRLVGTEPDLVTYLRLDEGAGTDLVNQCDRRRNAVQMGATWVTSDAPVGDGPGLSRDTFAVKGRQVTGGLAATLYYQQEPHATGYSTLAMEKRQARVLLACATTGPAPQGGSADRAYICTVDFALARGGRLAAVPTEVSLTAIGLPDTTKDLDALAAAQNRVSAAKAQLSADQKLADNIPAFLNYIATARKKHEKEWANTQMVPLLPSMYLASSRLGADEAHVVDAQAALATMSGGMQGGAEAVLPMPKVATDRAGLSVYGALLTFAWTDGAPSLLESANGDVVLYFRGGDGQFFAAYYPTTVSRATRTLAAAAGRLSLVARDPAARLEDVAVTVADGGTAGLCTVTVTSGTVVEKFLQVPRTAVDLARVLNGTHKPGAILGHVAAAQDQILELAEPLAEGLAAGAAITVGTRLRSVADAVSKGANKITVTVGGLTASAGHEVRTALYDYARATCTTPGVSLSAGSRIVAARTDDATGRVADGTASDGAPPLAPRWRGNSPGRALTFNGSTQYLSLSTADWPKVIPEADLSVEAWVNTPGVASSARIWHAAVPGTPYALSLTSRSPRTAMALLGAGGADCGSQLVLAGKDFTIEVWSARAVLGHGDILFGHGSTANQELRFGIDASNRAFVGWSQGGNLTCASTPGADLGWHCWSVTYTAATRLRTLYCDGVQIAQDTAPGAYQGSGRTVLGGGCDLVTWATGSVDEYRVWGHARTAADIALTAKRRLTGREPGLLGYWTFEEGSLQDRSGHGHDGTQVGVFLNHDSAPFSYGLSARIGAQVFRSKDAFPLADWGHMAMTFRQDWAMAMDGSAYLDAGGPAGLDLAGDLTIEAFVKLDGLGSPQGLVSKGAFETGAGDAVPYAFYVDSDGQLAFTFEDGDGAPGSRTTFRSVVPIKKGVFTKVAVTRAGGEDKEGTVAIRFYIDGKPIGDGPFKHGGAKPLGNDANCEIGRFRVRGSAFGLRGTVSEVRIWNTAREAKQIGVAITAQEQGLTAWWRFPESSGGVTADACDSYPARIVGARRVRTPDPAGNRAAFYHNGFPSGAVLVDANTDVLAVLGADQVTVGAAKDAADKVTGAFNGSLDELRVWRTCRTQEQILDNMFTRLRAEHTDLLAYYPFEPESTVLGATVHDFGPAACHLTPSTPPPGIEVSSAPISDDTAEVRSALAGARSIFNTTIGATPHASEYADLQADARGAMFGVMKRCYTALRDGAWTLTTGFKVGELTSTWVGQAQFNPQLIGYLEGAPPVPSENMVVGTADDYTDRSSVSFVQANTVTNTISSDHKKSVDASAKLHFEVSASSDIYNISAPLGVGVAQPASSAKMAVGGAFETKFSNSWSNDTQVSQGATTTRTSSVTLTGHWEPDDTAKQLNPTAGRRWVPANTGFAVVQSDTADQYALRLAHNGVLVAYRMVPNPDIPRDWNIVPFPINPRYTKQGTLDGIVGYTATGTSGALQPCPDKEHFPYAGDGGANSYYRPREAYALKRRIQREEQQLQGFYDSVSTDTHAPNPVAAAADRVLKGMMGGTGGTGLTTGGANTAAARSAQKSAARRNIVNTYVWTAAGGLFSEATTTTDQVVQTTTGEHTFSSMGTFSVSGETEIGPAGFKGGYELSLGGGFTNTRRKSADASRTFSLDVVANPGRDLQKRDGDTPVFDAAHKPVLLPGRVDAYRFMSFYLDTSTDNFEDFFGKVVDPDWLETSNHPHAKELARARQTDRKPPCWRIMHRVTYVSRILDTTSPSAPTLAKALGALGITSDHDLFTRLEPLLAGATDRLADLTAATNAALAEQYPTLVPHAETITARLAVYHQVATGDAVPPLQISLAATPAPSPTNSITLSAASVASGTRFSIHYTAVPAKVAAKTWIGIYTGSAGPGNGDAYDWEYAPTAGATISFPVKKPTLPVGSYRVYLLYNNGYEILAGPQTLTIT
ncbi:LamG domain-containing protein [Streptomycetaceae bacterium NBC_01309]